MLQKIMGSAYEKNWIDILSGLIKKLTRKIRRKKRCIKKIDEELTIQADNFQIFNASGIVGILKAKSIQ